jgi:hypothetical protein
VEDARKVEREGNRDKDREIDGVTLHEQENQRRENTGKRAAVCRCPKG